MFEPLPHRPRTASFAAVGILLVYFLIGASSAARQSITYDEPAHWRYGLQVLHGNTHRFDDSKMPVTALNALPLRFSKIFFPKTPATDPLLLWICRLPTLLAACLLGWLVFAWTRTMFGAGAGLATLGLFAVDPNIQAHAQWITTDIYASLGIIASLYTFWKYLEQPGTSRAAVAGVALGLAQLTKFTCVYLYLLLPVIAVIRAFSGPTDKRSPHANGRRAAFSRPLAHAGLIFVASLAVLGVGYLGNGWGTPLREYFFMSDVFYALQSHAGIFDRMPLPFPRPFLEGLDWVRMNEQSGSYRGAAYLWSQLNTAGFPNYFAWAYIFKVPLGTQIIFLGAFAYGAVRQNLRREHLRRLCPLIAPIIFFAVYFNYFSRAQMGIRMILPIFPLMYVYSGSLISGLRPPSLRRRLIGCVAVLWAWAAISVFSTYPHSLGYFNELAGGAGRHYRILADSNLEWGQNALFVKDYLIKNPGAQLDPSKPRPGRVLISANFLTGIVRPEKYAWARWVSANLKPVGTIANGAYLIYDLTPEDLNKL